MAAPELFGGAMPILKFLCPTTCVYFDSGIRVDETSASAARLNIVPVRCPQCGREHRFLLADGLLDESDMPFGGASSKPRLARKEHCEAAG